MLKPTPKQDYLDDLRARNRRNRETVQRLFLPLDREQRSWQPDPAEWSVDQCLQHLVLAFEMYVHNVTDALKKHQPAHADGIFRPSWWARRTLEWQFNPNTKLSTLRRANPPAPYGSGAIDRWLAQQERLATMLDQAAHADLQTMCRFFKWVPVRYNLGDYLNFFISHDELHIDQAQRVLAAYKQQAESVSADLSVA